jgi:maltooligosyltrehalose trehalohydrolase
MDFSATHILKEIRANVDRIIKQRWNMHYLIAEVDLNDVRYINPTEKAGYGMDAQWIDEFHHALRVTTGEERKGYYSDFEGIKHLAKAYQDAYVYDGVYSPHRQKHFGTKTDGQDGHQFVVFSQNHDQVGNRMLGERTSKLVSFEMRKLLGGATLVSPFLPLLFMGEEYSETNPFLYFVSHSDHSLIESVRKGRKAEFAAFHNDGEAPDPQAEETFNQSKLQWSLVHDGSHQTILSFYKELIALRRKHPALRHLNRKELDISFDENAKTIQLHRWYRDQHVLCLMNFSTEGQTIDVATDQSWLKVLDSADPQWEGPGASYGLLERNSPVNLQPESIAIYTSQYV